MARKKPKVSLAHTPKPHVGDLATLFSTDGDVEQASGLQLLAIRIDAIVADPSQPRKWFDDERLQELSDSIKQDGVIQPIEVTEIAPGSYMIVHGERRWRASQLAGRETIPAVVRRRNYDQTTRFVRQLVENIQREDLNDVDRAQGLIRLRDLMREELLAARDEGIEGKQSWKNQVTWTDVGKRLGYTRQRINQLTNLLDLPDEVQEGVRQGAISERETRVLRKLTPPQQRALFREYEAGEISSSEMRELASFLKERPTMMVQEAIQIMDEPPPPPTKGRPETIERSVLPAADTAVSPTPSATTPSQPATGSPTPPTSNLARRNNADLFRYIQKNLASLDQSALAADADESLRQLRLIRDAVSSMITVLENG